MPPSPHPLANLPRPLSERDGSYRRRWIHRLVAMGLIGTLAVGGLAVGSALIPGPVPPIGEVKGAVETPTVDVGPMPSTAPRSVGTSPDVDDTAGSPPVMDLEGRAASVGAPALSTLVGYRSPLPKGRLTLPFGPSPWGSRIVDGERFHDGMDLATFCGDRIVAAHGGTVLAAGRRYDSQMGWIGDLSAYTRRLDKKKLWSTLPIVVVIDDGNGYRSVYAHFSKVVVKKGAKVRAGQFIGYEGATGRASGCHLHYSLFSPLETRTFEIEKDVVKRMKLPRYQIARVDPALVLPPQAKPGKKAAASPESSEAP